MKTIGTIIAVIGFVLWFGGEFIGFPGLIGLALFIAGVVLYFIGRKKENRNK